MRCLEWSYRTRIHFPLLCILCSVAGKKCVPSNEYRKRGVSLLVGGGLDWLKGNERYNRSLLFPAPVSHFGEFEIALSSRSVYKPFRNCGLENLLLTNLLVAPEYNSRRARRGHHATPHIRGDIPAMFRAENAQTETGPALQDRAGRPARLESMFPC